MCDFHYGWITGPTAGHDPIGTDVNPASEKCPCGQHNDLGLVQAPVAKLHTSNTHTLHRKPHHRPLGELESLEPLELPAYSSPIQPSITLGPGRPDGGALGPIQHPEMNRGGIRRPPHDSTEGIHLTNHRSLGDAPDGGIAGHLSDGIQGCRHQQRATPHPSGGRGGLAARMSTTHDDNVESIRAMHR